MPSPFPQNFVTKTVPHKFAGVDLRYHLSHALFSSFDVDKGTMLLLKTLAQKLDLGSIKRVLDVGCGVGVIGLALKKKNPAIELVSQDRDALACAFTQENARLNGLSQGTTVLPALALEGVQGPFDLIVSNLPAKAGAPVLEDFFARSCGLLAPGGRVCVVIVEPLAAWTQETLKKLGLEVLYTEPGDDYLVLHYQGKASSSEDQFAPYLRDKVIAQQGKTTYAVQTHWGLPNFDSLDYPTLLAMELWEKRPQGGRVLFWESGQGHLPALAFALKKPAMTCAVLAGRDVLALHSSALAVPEGQSEVITVSHFAALADPAFKTILTGIDAVYLPLKSEPQISCEKEIQQTLIELLAPGTPVLVVGSSTDIHRFLDQKKGLISSGVDQKYRGYRAVWLKRSAS